MEDIKNIPEEFSFEKEKEIARSFSKRFQWEMILIGVGQATVWLSLWPLVINGYISLFFGSLIATICACFAYLPSHEAQHGNYSRGNPKRRWIDSFVSHFTLITIMFPHDLMRCTHMKHHAYTNNPEKDPDYDTASAKSLWEVIIATQVGIKKYESIAEIFKNDNAFMKSFNKGMIIGMMYRVILLTLVVMFPLETLLLWWLPSKFGIIYLSTFLAGTRITKQILEGIKILSSGVIGCLGT
ncbi:fatty acid desaturase [Gammaproteobacteria bacterium]|nr:fatty acid desaturase [Gammaproteobacteria bacterium]